MYRTVMYGKLTYSTPRLRAGMRNLDTCSMWVQALVITQREKKLPGLLELRALNLDTFTLLYDIPGHVTSSNSGTQLLMTGRGWRGRVFASLGSLNALQACSILTC